jgi:hypothetical protein
MGMFDSIRNNYDIGPGFNNRILQTKNICATPTMRNFWIDPAGQLWEIDCNGTHDFCEDGNDILGFRWVRNGNRGRCSPVYLTSSVTVYPEKWDCKYAPFPECRLLFRKGVVEVVTNIVKS